MRPWRRIELEPSLGLRKLSLNSERVFYLCQLRCTLNACVHATQTRICAFTWLKRDVTTRCNAGGTVVLVSTPEQLDN